MLLWSRRADAFCWLWRRFRQASPNASQPMMKHVEARMRFNARDDVANRVIAHVAHVQRAGGIRQHFRACNIWVRGIYFRIEDARFRPSAFAIWASISCGCNRPRLFFLY